MKTESYSAGAIRPSASISNQVVFRRGFFRNLIRGGWRYSGHYRCTRLRRRPIWLRRRGAIFHFLLPRPAARSGQPKQSVQHAWSVAPVRIAALAVYQLCKLFPASQRRSLRAKGLEDLGMMLADGVGQKKPVKRGSTNVLLLDAVEHVAMDYHVDNHRVQQSRADLNGHRRLRGRADLIEPGPGFVELVVGLYLPANTIQVAHLMRPMGPAFIDGGPSDGLTVC